MQIIVKIVNIGKTNYILGQDMTRSHAIKVNSFPSKKRKEEANKWFKELRNLICKSFEDLENEVSTNPAKFRYTKWKRSTDRKKDKGGGEMALMHGKVFEKVGVNISTVYGKFSNEFRKEIPGAIKNPNFWASGISLVAHTQSPLIPTVHMNTRSIITSKSWFGGGADITPTFPKSRKSRIDAKEFHLALKKTCDKHNSKYYPKFKKWCDDYFFLKHRNESRGLGGIFFDYLNTGKWEKDFNFTQDIGRTFCDIYPKIVRKNMKKKWTNKEKEQQLIRRGRYVEFNLLYDRGTKFGLMTDGNPEAILMSLPPIARWP